MKFQDNELVYIKPNLALEPLVDNWYAWSHLISPATACMNIKERHLKIMESYIQAPQIHAAAVKNPKMLGGPFIDYNGQRVEEIRGLKENTQEVCSDMLDLADAFNDLNDMLLAEAKGFSLEPLYPMVPEQLRGLVELVYDLNNNPSYRIFEPLLYETKYYKEELQSIQLFLVTDDDSRSFVLSTPKLPEPDSLRINLPFKSKKIDKLFAMSRTPQPYGHIRELLDIQPEQEAIFETFFTREAPAPYQKYEGDGVLTRYFGHACILAETKDTSILVDPVVSYGYESDISRYTYADLPDTIDYVLITHNHQDHILFETLLQLRDRIKHIIVPKSSGGGIQDPSLKLMFERIGFNNVIELSDLESIEFDRCTISGIPFLGEHADLDIRSKLCHHVQFKDNLSILFAADSCNIEPMLYERVREVFGSVDVVFLGMECDGAPLSWLYGPLMPKALDRQQDQTRRLAGCDYEQSKALIDCFEPREVFVYAMGMEPWLKYISSIKYTDESKPIIHSNRVLEYCQAQGVESERLFGEKIIEYAPQLQEA